MSKFWTGTVFNLNKYVKNNIGRNNMTRDISLCLYLQKVHMNVILSEFQHVHAGDMLQELKDAHTVGRVHVALEKLSADRHHLTQLQHVCCHH